MLIHRIKETGQSKLLKNKAFEVFSQILPDLKLDEDHVHEAQGDNAHYISIDRMYRSGQNNITTPSGASTSS